MGYEWWQWCLFLLSFGVVMIAVKFVVTFDVTESRKQRHDNRKSKARMACPHASLREENGQYFFQSEVYSPIGRSDGQCQRCGMHFVGGLHAGEKLVREYAKNPRLYLEREKLFAKAVKKLM